MNEMKFIPKIARISGQEVSWIGPCPWTGGYGFGTDSGKILLPKKKPGAGESEEVKWWPVASEPINGVAFSGDFMAVSTRAEVVVCRYDPVSGGFAHETERFEGGAHGIAARASGGFLAPLGSGGLLRVDFNGVTPVMSIGDFGQNSPNLYKLFNLGVIDGEEVFACAARKDGLLSIRLDRGRIQFPIYGHTADSFDLIDVCPLDTSRRPLAAAALSVDRSIIFWDDIRDEPLYVLQIEGLTGRGYSLICSQGHLFLLTSTTLMILPDLATLFLNGGMSNRPGEGFGKSIRASDAFLLDGEIGLIVKDHVEALPIGELVAVSSAKARTAGVQSTDWNAIYSRSPTSVTSWLPGETARSFVMSFGSAPSDVGDLQPVN